MTNTTESIGSDAQHFVAYNAEHPAYAGIAAAWRLLGDDSRYVCCMTCGCYYAVYSMYTHRLSCFATRAELNKATVELIATKPPDWIASKTATGGQP
jgi:hypothetical protein